MVKCLLCRDQGAEGGCKRCGKFPVVTENFAKFAKTVEIPNAYRDNLVWNEEKLLKSHPSRSDDTAFKKYAKILTALDKEIGTGMLPNKSLMIISDRGCGKHTFAYSIMNRLAKTEHTVCPLIDHTEFLRLCALSVEKPWEKQRLMLDDIVYSDLCIMTVDPCFRYTALKAIQSILMKRGHAGKPTYILSDFPLSTLETDWNKGEDIRYVDGLDPLRYCRVIRG